MNNLDSPKLYVLIMGLICCFIITQYCFDHDKYMLNVDEDDKEVLGNWGIPDAEFNWCEKDYRLSIFVAEPLNSVSGICFVFVFFIGEYYHYYMLSTNLHLILIFSALIGFGTILFHSSLRYKAQLLDEIPMYYLMVCIFLELSKIGKNIYVLYLSWIWATLLSISLFIIPRDNFNHEIMRAIMSCSFTATFVWVFYIISYKISLIHNDQFKNQVQYLFKISFIHFVIAEISWLLDNGLCPLLRTLPIYINLHSVWHICSSIGMYGLWLCCVSIQYSSKDVYAVQWIKNGLVPIISLRENNKLK